MHAESEEMRNRLMSEFDHVYFDRVGRLEGEFVSNDTGLLLLDRAGACLQANFPPGSSMAATMPFSEANQPGLWDHAQSLREGWDELPLIENAAVFSHIYYSNYYHFCFEFMQKFRLIEPFDIKVVIMPAPIYRQGVFREMISRVLGDRLLLPANELVRLKNPMLADGWQSEESLRWLREFVGKTLPAQGRRYYVRRNPPKGRNGNNIAETEAFLAFLERHDFTTIDFGNGELSLAEQIDKLQGASFVLAAHGAGLTNLSYLEGPARVIEVFGRSVISTSFIRISDALGLDHHAIIAETLDERGDIVVDCDLLESLMD
ncbi:glycosyltransferase family 61 protein [Caulobacter sp.]|uniref:glycosyltransferase family 61 protein n=1 Tax=Caulobacter sp. TaxID=78 RepID=UPI002B4A08B2|nr:glycosyltransferase family 61 protein [Caulobacter sp.]HJV40419.1 glycosyltransferase family 61 protein [Caulobacter sp.]